MPDLGSIQIRINFDIAITRELVKANDDATKHHTIDHHFFGNDKGNVEAVAQLTRILGFKPGEVKSRVLDDQTTRFSLDVQSVSITAIQISYRNSILMLAIAEACKCTYDGWGTFAVRKEQVQAAPSAD